MLRSTDFKPSFTKKLLLSCKILSGREEGKHSFNFTYLYLIIIPSLWEQCIAGLSKLKNCESEANLFCCCCCKRKLPFSKSFSRLSTPVPEARPDRNGKQRGGGFERSYVLDGISSMHAYFIPGVGLKLMKKKGECSSFISFLYLALVYLPQPCLMLIRGPLQ